MRALAYASVCERSPTYERMRAYASARLQASGERILACSEWRIRLRMRALAYKRVASVSGERIPLHCSESTRMQASGERMLVAYASERMLVVCSHRSLTACSVRGYNRIGVESLWTA
jgi:hypothetical protein